MHKKEFNLNLKIYFDKPSNSNPYYGQNLELNQLSNIIQQITQDKQFKHGVEIQQIIGGQRNQSPHECEMTVSITQNGPHNEIELKNKLIELVGKCHGKYMELPNEKP